MTDPSDEPPPPAPTRLDRVEGGLRKVWPLAVVALLVLVAVLGYRAATHPERGDTRFWGTGAKRFVDGDNLYFWEPHVPGQYNPNTGYTYPPPFAVFSTWMLAVPYPAARVLWLLAMTACMLGAGWLTWRLIGHGRAPPRRAALLWLLVSLVLARLAINDLAHGQSNWLITLLLLFGLLRAEESKPWPAGIALGLALAIKPTAWLLLPFFLIARRDFKLVGASALTLIVVLSLPGLRYGSDYVTVCGDWFRLMARFSNENFANPENASLAVALTRVASGSMQEGGDSLAPFLFRFDHRASIPWARGIAVVGVAAAFALVCWRRARSAAAPAAILVLGALLSPVTWKAHLVVLVLPLAWLCRRLVEQPTKGGWILWGALLLLVALPSRGVLDLGAVEAWGTLTAALIAVFLALMVPASQSVGEGAPQGWTLSRFWIWPCK